MAGKRMVRRAALGAALALGTAAARVGAEAPATPCSAIMLPPQAPPPQAASRLGLAGARYVDPQTRMSEAGVTWSVGSRLTLQLSYERTAFAPLMSRDHDDGIITRIRLGF